MSVKLRFRRMGRKQHPVFGLVATDARSPRDGRFIELLGTYDPLAKIVRLKKDRCHHWVKVGAQPSKTANYLISLLEKEGAVINLSEEGADKAATDAHKAAKAEAKAAARAETQRQHAAAAEAADKAEEAPAEEAAADAEATDSEEAAGDEGASEEA